MIIFNIGYWAKYKKVEALNFHGKYLKKDQYEEGSWTHSPQTLLARSVSIFPAFISVLSNFFDTVGHQQILVETDRPSQKIKKQRFIYL